MPWFDTYVNAPEVQQEYSAETERLFYNGWNKRSITTESYTRPGLTYAAAKAGADTLSTDSVQTRVRRENPAGAFTLEVTTVISGAWEADT